MPNSKSHNTGSSPRARGTFFARPRNRIAGRFIPARAGNVASRRAEAPFRAVHPRARGERTTRRPCALAARGSSPRARGTWRRRRPRRRPSRFIPARAGNVRWRPRRARTRSVHPRARGERYTPAPPSQPIDGSSPRARGTCVRGRRVNRYSRFIPARAGNVPRGRCRARRRPVHPRARGERLPSRPVRCPSSGSSPRARGTSVLPEGGLRVCRFIPARAGNVRRWRSIRDGSPVHPRARGERVRTGRGPGSPARFIPARAGNVSVAVASHHTTPVHPRARGERPVTAHRPCECSGSSPRARGTCLPLSPLPLPSRFIPARAGNVGRWTQDVIRTTVHPRARGERFGPSTHGAVPAGSSPRARGTSLAVADADAELRFIPARAGNVTQQRTVLTPRPVHPRARGERRSISG